MRQSTAFSKHTHIIPHPPPPCQPRIFISAYQQHPLFSFLSIDNVPNFYFRLLSAHCKPSYHSAVLPPPLSYRLRAAYRPNGAYLKRNYPYTAPFKNVRHSSKSAARPTCVIPFPQNSVPCPRNSTPNPPSFPHAATRYSPKSRPRQSARYSSTQ